MNIKEYLKDNIVILDGGMGTLLQKEGLLPGEAPELWNITHPETVIKIHKAYFDAGSNVVNTNTFGANSMHFSNEELKTVISAAVKNAKSAREASTGSHPKYIALDIGPTGRLLKPYGDLDFENAVSVFAEVVKLGVDAGVDLITVETMNDSYETKAALLAVKENCDLPVFVTNAYGEDGKLMTGASPEAMCALLEGMHADAVGLNCSLGPAQLKPIAEKLLSVSSLPVIFKPNAGLPKVCGGETVYDVSPDDFAETVKELAQLGVRVFGGCCGTTPEHINRISEITADIKPVPISEKNVTVISSYTHAVTFGKTPVLIGERINPTGKKRFREALCENDINYILNEGLTQAEHGVHVLDVNVGLPEINESEVLSSVVTELQAVCNLPLQIDTASPVAMEKALRLYNGKALVNSVNGTCESMEAVFPVVKKYGGTLIALTLDENGIPSTADARFEIAEKILNTAEKYGIKPKDIIFDTLTMTVSAGPKAAEITLKSLKLIQDKLNCKTSLGVSNISFGLPQRDIINAAFFNAALESGLSAAIMNPYSAEMMSTYYAFKALHGLDENCAEYISFCETLPGKTETVTAAVNPAAQDMDASSLQTAIRKGLKTAATETTAELLKSKAPLDIINGEIIPALDFVGKGFEEKTVFLPQLLMSAEAAKAAFEVIKNACPVSDAEKGKKIVLATVKGDIHDIGKNIVKLLLQNYGFVVYDLGKDVPPETVVSKAAEFGAAAVGLSALMTTTVPAMEQTVKMLHENLPDCKVIVGGAVLNEEYAKQIKADAYAKDAMETVRFAKTL